MSCSAWKAKTSLGYTTAQWFSMTIKTSIASLGTWSKTWLVGVHTRASVCCHWYAGVSEPDQRTSFPHEGIIKHAFHCFCSQLTFLLHIQIFFYLYSPHNFVLTVHMPPMLLHDWSLTLTFDFLCSLLTFFQEKQDPSSTSLQLRTEIQVGRDAMCTKHKHGVSFTQSFAKAPIWRLSPSLCPQESLGFSSEVSTPETDRK